MLEGLPEAHANRLRELLERNLGSMGGSGFLPSDNPDGQFENPLKMMRDQMDRAMSGDVSEFLPDSGTNTDFQRSSTIRIMDSEGSVEIMSVR